MADQLASVLAYWLVEGLAKAYLLAPALASSQACWLVQASVYSLAWACLSVLAYSLALA